MITLRGVERLAYKENDTLTVECTIDRLYPQIQPADFTMRWGDTVIEAVGKNNTDGSYGYRVQITKTLTKEDNGLTITCNVYPVIGTPVSVERIIHVEGKYVTLQMLCKIVFNKRFSRPRHLQGKGCKTGLC